ncbi:MAG: peptidase M19, partial [Verrucomicrobiales bacterium]|nr:peptidase M19 [Verrucomicrobiales bacterium]
MPDTASFIFDVHLDLSMNALEWNRDLSRPLDEIREREAGQTDKPDRGQGTVSLPEMRRGNIGLCVGTQIARYTKRHNPLPGWHSPAQAWAQTQGQLAWYREMEQQGKLAQITNLEQLETHLAKWKSDPTESLPVGYVLSLEGADSMVTLGHLEQAYASGLRALGPAHYGPGTYAPGTDESGPLGQAGPDLLREMERLGIILDVTHLSDESLDQAMDLFGGTVWASHCNCRALVPGDRQLSDEQLKRVIERDGVIGAAFDAWMLIPDWQRGVTTPESSGVALSHVVDHIDYVCQLAGDAKHACIGTDLDGGFGREQSPGD